MIWFRIESIFEDHPKFEKLNNAQIGLWVRCMAYCSKHDTGGTMPMSAAKKRAGKRGSKDLTMLQSVGLAVANGTELVLNGYAKWQPSVHNQDTKRAAIRQRVDAYRRKKIENDVPCNALQVHTVTLLDQSREDQSREEIDPTPVDGTAPPAPMALELAPAEPVKRRRKPRAAPVVDDRPESDWSAAKRAYEAAYEAAYSEPPLRFGAAEGALLAKMLREVGGLEATRRVFANAYGNPQRLARQNRRLTLRDVASNPDAFGTRADQLAQSGIYRRAEIRNAVQGNGEMTAEKLEEHRKFFAEVNEREHQEKLAAGGEECPF